MINLHPTVASDVGTKPSYKVGGDGAEDGENGGKSHSQEVFLIPWHALPSSDKSRSVICAVVYRNSGQGNQVIIHYIHPKRDQYPPVS